MVTATSRVDEQHTTATTIIARERYRGNQKPSWPGRAAILWRSLASLHLGQAKTIPVEAYGYDTILRLRASNDARATATGIRL